MEMLSRMDWWVCVRNLWWLLLFPWCSGEELWGSIAEDAQLTSVSIKVMIGESEF